MDLPLRAIVASVTGLLMATPIVQAAERGPTGGSQVRITHGSELTASKVGPGALGLHPKGRYPGATIRDGRDYPFARKIPVSARYDGFDVTGPHLLIENVEFTGPLDIYSGTSVVMRGVSVRTRRRAHWAVHTRPQAGPLYFLWSRARAASVAGAPDDKSGALERALYLRADKAVVYRSHLSHTADGIQLHATGARIIETLIDQLTYWTDDHNDGIQMLGRGADAHILRNRIVNANPQTSCLNLIGDRVLVESNYLAGGGWVIYGGARRNGHGPGTTRGVVVRGNLFGREVWDKGGNFGVIAYWDSRPDTGNRWSGNHFTDGQTVMPGGRAR